MNRLPARAKPLRHAFHRELRRWKSLQFLLERHQGFSKSFERSGAVLMNPVVSEFCMKLSMEARGVSAENVIRFHDCAIRSGAMSLRVSASSSALINFCA